MLPADIWKPWEPRVIFPVFANCENVFDFAIQRSLFAFDRRSLAKPLYYFFKKQKSFASMFRDYWSLLTRKKISFRGGYMNRDGLLLKQWAFPGRYGVGESFSVNLNQILRESGVSLEDGEFLLVSSRGRPDLWASSPGNVTARYIGPEFIAGYRTGFFARPLNSDSKGHFGFTGVNPKIVLNESLEPSLMLLNHSSEPGYERSVRPSVRLHRTTEEFIEADFGEIPPFGVRERSLRDLFPDADAFLKSSNGIGYTITQAKGATLASLHLLRSREGTTMGIEHSRPAHPNVVNYTQNKGYMKK